MNIDDFFKKPDFLKNYGNNILLNTKEYNILKKYNIDPNKYNNTKSLIFDIEKILEEIKSNRPKAELYLESIYPVNHDIRRNNAGNRENSDIKEINEELEDYCEDNDITYIDMYDLLKDEEGNLKEEYTKDGLHLSDKGYEVVTKEIKQIIS